MKTLREKKNSSRDRRPTPSFFSPHFTHNPLVHKNCKIPTIGLTGMITRNPVRLGSASASFFSRSLRSSSISFLNAGSLRYFETFARRVSTSCLGGDFVFIYLHGLFC